MRNPLNLLLILAVVALLAQYVFHAPPLVVFVASALAIVPLAKWMGTATEELSARSGPGIGGLLNASFGNATELIIGLLAIRAGLLDVVKASITGSIIGNVLFILGLSMVMGGLRRDHQLFNRTAAGAAAGQLTLATIALVVPATFAVTFGGSRPDTELLESELVAGLLILSYGLSLLFSLRTHAHLYAAEVAAEYGELWSVRKALLVLAAATALVGVMAELLVHSVEGVTHDLGWSALFIGVIVIPLIGNAAEHLTAVTVAMKNKMDLSIGIAFGSSTQVALLISPILVLASLPLGQNMNLLFSPVELVAIASSVLIANVIAQDGESNWFEGAQLLIAYGIIAVGFFLYH